MRSEKKKLWDRLIKVWSRDTPACQVYLAEVYTKRFPDDFFGWVVLADGLTQISSFEKAQIALRTARRICPPDHRDLIYSRFGHYYREKGNLSSAEKWYLKTVNLSESQEYLVFLGACLAKQGKYSEAKRYHQKAIRLDPSKADESYFNLGLVLRAEGKFVEALRNFEKAIEIDPVYGEAKVARTDIENLLRLRAASSSPRKKIRTA